MPASFSMACQQQMLLLVAQLSLLVMLVAHPTHSHTLNHSLTLTHTSNDPSPSPSPSPAFNCSIFGCTCQGFANYFGTHSGEGFGCAGPQARDWWTNVMHCQANANCSCCKGPACSLPGAAPCICPHGPKPPVPAPPAIHCDNPLETTYVCTSCRRPDFSWDHLPVFIHVSVESTVAFAPAALEVLVKFPIVTIEKWQGCEAPEYTFEESAMIVAAKQIKTRAAELSKNISVVVWFDSFRIYANKTLNPNSTGTAGIGCMNSHAAHELESNKQNLLHDSAGNLVLESFSHLHVVDYQHRAMQVYKRDMCLNMTMSGFVDGCGMDGSQQRAAATGAIPGVAPINASAWNNGKVCMMNGTTAAIGDGVALGKMAFELGGPDGYANGIIQEGCTNSNETVTNLRVIAQRGVSLGIPLIYECHANCNQGPECESSIAAFLVGAGPYAFWGFGSWVTNGQDELLEDRWLSVFERPLGDPVADATYDVDTATWYRKFTSGTTVTFNALNNSGTIAWSSY